MQKPIRVLCSSLFTRLGILALLVLSLVAVSFPKSQSAQACGRCWYAIGCQCWTCSPTEKTACTLNPGGGADCQSGGECKDDGGFVPEGPPEN